MDKLKVVELYQVNVNEWKGKLDDIGVKALELECQRNPKLKKACEDVAKMLARPMAFASVDYEGILKNFMKVERRL